MQIKSVFIFYLTFVRIAKSNKEKDSSSQQGYGTFLKIIHCVGDSKSLNNGTYQTVFRKTEQAAGSVRCRYLHPINGQKLRTHVVELEKS